MPAILPSRVTEVRLCRVDEIPLGLGQSFEMNGQLVAVFRTRSGEIRAVEGTCPHRGAPLADGILAGDRVVCPYHAMKFDLSSGQCDRPETCPIQVYAARVSDGWVYLTVNELVNS